MFNFNKIITFFRQYTPDFLYDRGIYPKSTKNCDIYDGSHSWYISSYEHKIEKCIHCDFEKEATEDQIKKYREAQKAFYEKNLQG